MLHVIVKKFKTEFNWITSKHLLLSCTTEEKFVRRIVAAGAVTTSRFVVRASAAVKPYWAIPERIWCQRVSDPGSRPM